MTSKSLADETETKVREITESLLNWSHRQARDYGQPDLLFSKYGEVLRRFLPVDRFLCGYIVMHPQVAARTWKWESPDKLTEYSFTREQSKEWKSTYDNRKYNRNGQICSRKLSNEFLILEAFGV